LYDGEECTKEPGRGGNGGKGGDACLPGRGGNGGNGGLIKIFIKSVIQAQQWNCIVKGGKAGQVGTPGNRGPKGKGGPQGTKHDPCPEKSEYRGSDGQDGRTIDEIDPSWQNNFEGSDGIDGDVGIHEITGVPN
jgi:hypothetical protein